MGADRSWRGPEPGGPAGLRTKDDDSESPYGHNYDFCVISGKSGGIPEGRFRIPHSPKGAHRGDCIPIPEVRLMATERSAVRRQLAHRPGHSPRSDTRRLRGLFRPRILLSEPHCHDCHDPCHDRGPGRRRYEGRRRGSRTQGGRADQ